MNSADLTFPQNAYVFACQVDGYALWSMAPGTNLLESIALDSIRIIAREVKALAEPYLTGAAIWSPLIGDAAPTALALKHSDLIRLVENYAAWLTEARPRTAFSHPHTQIRHVTISAKAFTN